MASDRDNTNRRSKERLTIKVVIGPCRLSFPHFFTPAETDSGDRYQANFLFPPSWTKQPDYKKFEDALYEVCEDMHGPEKEWKRNKTSRYADEVIRDATEKEYEGYNKGWFFIKAGSKDPVGLIDANKERVTNERDVYGGRWCRISVTIAAYDNKSKGVGVYLNSVQLLDHDEPFGGRGPAENDFDDWQGGPLSNDDRGTGRGHARERDGDDDRRERGRDRDDRGDDRRRSRGDDDGARGSRGRGREDEEAPRGGRGRDREEPRRGDRNRDPDDDRSSSRRRNEDDEPKGARSRRDEPEDDRPSRGRDRDTDRSERRGRDEDDRPRGRSSEDRDDDERPSRGRGRSRDDDDNWN